jgi:hypothetical protein
MPILVSPDGKTEYVSDEDLAAKVGQGYAAPRGESVAVTDADGRTVAIEGDRLADWVIEQQGGIASTGAQDEAAHARAVEETYGGVGGGAAALGLGAARGLTLGASDMLARGLGADMDVVRDIGETHEGLSLAGEIGGAVIPGLLTGGAGAAGLAGRALARTPAGLAARAGSAAGARVGSGLAGAAATGAVEGAIFGAGTGISEVSLSEDPVTLEKAAGSISSGMLLGGVVGGGASLAGKALEKGLRRTRDMVRRSPVGDLPESLADDLTQLDRKGLRAAKDAEYERIKGDRLTAGESMVEEVKAYRAALKEADNLYTLTKGAKKGSALAEAGGRTRKALRQLRSALDTPAELAARPSQVRKALAQLDQTFKDLAAEAPALRAAAEGGGGSRLKALDALEGLTETNRRLQSTVAELTTPIRESVTPRLKQIDDAVDALSSQGGPSFGQKLVEGSAFGVVTGAVAPFTGPLAPLIGGAAAGKVGELVFGRLGKAASDMTKRIDKALTTVLDVGSKTVSKVGVPATVLSTARFGPDDRKRPEAKGSGKVKAFRERAQELQAQVQAGPDGRPQMTRAARARVADQLAGARAASLPVADALETVAARKVEFLAGKLPKQPFAGFGPSNWRPSDFEIAQFSRYVAAVEDPASVIERVADGSLTPEDAEALRSVYPELYADMQRQLIEKLPELREQLPYQRRLMLSIFFGVPVDPAMSPDVLAVLQGHFAREESTAGGSHSPMPEPSFGALGSVAKESPTKAQERSG